MSFQFLDFLHKSPLPLLSDGAMGTMLAAHGPAFDQCLDCLNLYKPESVTEVHRLYIEAGSQVIQTNTFGANRFKLAQYGLSNQTYQINRSGVDLAVSAARSTTQKIFVAGDVGPLGVRLAPYGRVQPDQARQAFCEQITALSEAGVDLIILETFTDLSEIIEAIASARQVCALPVIASLTFTRDDLTLLGDTPKRAAQELAAAGADLIGVNCSGGPAQIWRILRQMRQAAPAASFSAMPNAGWPEQVGGRIMYPANPDYFGDYALAFCEAGARLIGGCCGTTPAHIAAMRRAIQNIHGRCAPSTSELALPVEVEEQGQSHELASPLAQKLAEGRFVISVEMDPPRGLSTHKLIAGASLLAESGADVINIADSPMARMRMSPWAVCSLINLRVGIDTTLHFPTRGRNLLRVQGDLLAAHALGIRNVFVVMGDPTAIGDYPEAMDNYDLVPSGLIQLIKGSFNLGLDHAGAEIGQPTSFFVGAALNLAPQNTEQEIKNLNRKLKSGVDFFLTQPVFNPDTASAFFYDYTSRHGPLNVPVLVGVLPLFSPRHAAFLHNEVPGVTIPEPIQERIRSAGENAPQVGVQIALDLIEQMQSWAAGVYLMPQFGRFDLAAEIVERVKNTLFQVSAKPENDLLPGSAS